MLILGIETSCDDTSVAVVKDGKKILSNIISSQDPVHQSYGGIYPEMAAREHLKNMSYVFNKALDDANCKLQDIDYIAATYAPGLIGSLLVGLNFGKALAYAADIPFVPVHHIKGHVYSSFIENDVELPAIALVVSGGHSSLIYLDSEHNFSELGYTVDDAIGETYDKVARMLNLGFPGGPVIDKRAKLGNSNYLKIPVPKLNEKLNFSFSGIKTAILNHVRKVGLENLNVDDVCASFQKGVVDILVAKVLEAAEELDNKTIILAGGVAANSLLREKLKDAADKKRLTLAYPSLKLCTDNAAMIATAAYYMLINNKKIRPGFDTIAESYVNVEDD